MSIGTSLAAASRVLDGARGMARVFRADVSQGVELEHAAHRAALAQFAAEFGEQPSGFDRAVNGLNRLPRPFLAFGTLGLFIYAMADPSGFSIRMTGLAVVPDPLWWLLGAIVGFYFGARELHHMRAPRSVPMPAPVTSSWHVSESDGAAEEDTVEGIETNPALAAWRNGTG